MTKLDIYWTPKFKASLSRYNGVQEFVAAKTSEIVKKFHSNPKTWSQDLEKLKDTSFRDIKAYRVKVTEGDRLIVTIKDTRLNLVAIGDHKVMDSYSREPQAVRKADLDRAEPVEDWFQQRIKEYLEKDRKRAVRGKGEVKLSKVLQESHVLSDSRWLYEAELSQDWVQYLDEEQAEVCEKIFEKIVEPHSELKILFLMGGPGTGKTIVLFNLALRLKNAGRSLSFLANDQVARYLNRGNEKVPSLNLGFAPGVVILLDDPLSMDEFKDALRKARSNACSAIVIGFDPLQWHERKMEEKFRKICETNEYLFFPLWKCYRQSYGVARKSQELLETIYGKSSRFFEEEKQKLERDEMQPYLDLTLGMEFVDEQGRYVVHESEVDVNLEKEVKRIKSRLDLWKHSAPICLVIEDSLLDDYRRALTDKFRGLGKMELPLSKYKKIRGVEFQELLLFVSGNFWDSINAGSNGLGSQAWEKLTSLHTILSRPKDSLAIFVLKGKSEDI